MIDTNTKEYKKEYSAGYCLPLPFSQSFSFVINTYTTLVGKKNADECGIDNLSGGLSAGIKATIHLANEVVDGNYWGFILVGTRNEQLDTYGQVCIQLLMLVELLF